MASFFTKNLVVVYFLYGLAFFIMGIAILSQPKNKSQFRLANFLWLLALFGFTHGLNEFLDMWAIMKANGQFFVLYRLWILAISYFFLFEFGRRLLYMSISTCPPYYKKLSKLFPFWLSFFMSAIVVVRLILYPDDWDAGVTMARYFLGFPGGILTGSSFILYYSCNRKILDDIKARKYFLGAAASFFVYGVIGGLIVPKGNLFLSNWLNTDSFLLLFKFPVQVLRAVCALVSTWAVCGILRIFNWEENERLQAKIIEYGKLERISDGLRGIVNIAEELIVCPDLDALFKMSVEFCREKLGIERCAIFLAEDEYMVGTYGTDRNGRTVDEHAQRFLKDEAWSNRCKMIKKGEQSWFVVEEPYLEWNGTNTVQIGKGWIVVTPIQTAKSVIGVFVNDTAISQAQLNLINQDMLAVFSSLLGDIVELKRADELIESHVSVIEIVNKQLHNEIAHRKRLEEELRALSITDSVTGLYNHRGFLELGQQQMKLAKRNKQDVVMLFVDLDKLKWINDTFGHQEGDLALADVASVFRATFRESDITARIGGDEFIVLLATHAGKDSISHLIAKLLNKLNEHNLKATRGYPLSLSIGGAFSDANHPCTIDELLSKADKLMYKQKQTKGSNGK